MVSEDRSLGKMPQARIITSSAPLYSAPRNDSSLDNEGLFGEAFEVTGSENGFAFGSLYTDGYKGWVPLNCLAEKIPNPNAQLIVPMTNVTADSNIKSSSFFSLSLGAMVNVVSAQNDRAKITTPSGYGFISCRHIRALSKSQNNFERASDSSADHDWVSLAESFIGSPYKWGGRTAWGLDCSALLQLVLAGNGISVPRDSGPQHYIGVSIGNRSDLQRGDLVFWHGHVGIMQDHRLLLHANAHHMAVASEPLSTAIKRIGAIAGPVTALRRLNF